MLGSLVTQVQSAATLSGQLAFAAPTSPQSVRQPRYLVSLLPQEHNVASPPHMVDWQAATENAWLEPTPSHPPWASGFELPPPQPAKPVRKPATVITRVRWRIFTPPSIGPQPWSGYHHKPTARFGNPVMLSKPGDDGIDESSSFDEDSWRQANTPRRLSLLASRPLIDFSAWPDSHRARSYCSL